MKFERRLMSNFKIYFSQTKVNFFGNSSIFIFPWLTSCKKRSLGSQFTGSFRIILMRNGHPPITRRIHYQFLHVLWSFISFNSFNCKKTKKKQAKLRCITYELTASPQRFWQLFKLRTTNFPCKEKA